MMTIEHLGFIVASYVLAGLVTLALISWVMLDHRTQKARLEKLEAQGVARRSGAKLS